jgi:hypothetical protein
VLQDGAVEGFSAAGWSGKVLRTLSCICWDLLGRKYNLANYI